MGNNKKGGIGLLGGILIIIVVGFIIWYGSSTLLAKSSSSALDPIKKWISPDTKEDLDKQKEEQRLKSELLSNAENSYSQFETGIKNCIIKNSDKACNCVVMDFTNLNSYILKVSDEKGVKILELLDSTFVPVGNKKSSMGSFFISTIAPRDSNSGASVSELPTGEVGFYNSPENLVFKGTQVERVFSPVDFMEFSKDSINIKKMIANKQVNYEAYSQNMGKLSFVKIPKEVRMAGGIMPDNDVILIYENEPGFAKCST